MTLFISEDLNLKMEPFNAQNFVTMRMREASVSAPELDEDEAAVLKKKAAKAIWPWHQFLPTEQTWKKRGRRRV